MLSLVINAFYLSISLPCAICYANTHSSFLHILSSSVRLFYYLLLSLLDQLKLVGEVTMLHIHIIPFLFLATMLRKALLAHP